LQINRLTAKIMINMMVLHATNALEIQIIQIFQAFKQQTY